MAYAGVSGNLLRGGLLAVGATAGGVATAWHSGVSAASSGASVGTMSRAGAASPAGGAADPHLTKTAGSGLAALDPTGLAGGNTLAVTGIPVGLLVLLALGLVVIGLVVVRLSMVRRANGDHPAPVPAPAGMQGEA